MKAGKCKNDPERFIVVDNKGNIYADKEELVEQDVDFYALSPCKVYFEENSTVFPKNMYELGEGDNWKTPTGHGKTRYAIDHRPAAKPAGGDPILVVP